MERIFRPRGFGNSIRFLNILTNVPKNVKQKTGNRGLHLFDIKRKTRLSVSLLIISIGQVKYRRYSRQKAAKLKKKDTPKRVFLFGGDWETRTLDLLRVKQAL